MKSFRSYFDGFAGGAAAITRLCGALESGRLPHALFIAAPAGCGRNLFARAAAAAYLGDAAGLCARGAHPDCLVLRGEGASGNIPVRRVRELCYELGLSAVMSEGRRAAIIEDAGNLNRNSANALLKVLEEPPDGVVFLLTGGSRADLLETLLSRCVEIALTPPTPEECLAWAAARYPDYDRARLETLCRRVQGRPGLLAALLSAPERLALSDAGDRFVAAALRRDKLAALSELGAATSREELRVLLEGSALLLRDAVARDPDAAPGADALSESIAEGLQALSRYAGTPLVAARIVSRL